MTATRNIISKDILVNTVTAKLAEAGTKLTKVEVKSVVEGVLSAVRAGLVDGADVRLTGIGTLRTKMTGERQSRNVRTGEPLLVPARLAVKFNPATDLKESIAATPVTTAV